MSLRLPVALEDTCLLTTNQPFDVCCFLLCDILCLGDVLSQKSGLSALESKILTIPLSFFVALHCVVGKYKMVLLFAFPFLSFIIFIFL
jgi:hypothetical protein